MRADNEERALAAARGEPRGVGGWILLLLAGIAIRALWEGHAAILAASQGQGLAAGGHVIWASAALWALTLGAIGSRGFPEMLGALYAVEVLWAIHAYGVLALPTIVALGVILVLYTGSSRRWEHTYRGR